MKEYTAIVVMDKQHRVTIPKAIRDLEGWQSGDTVEIVIRGTIGSTKGKDTLCPA